MKWKEKKVWFLKWKWKKVLLFEDVMRSIYRSMVGFSKYNSWRFFRLYFKKMWFFPIFQFFMIFKYFLIFKDIDWSRSLICKDQIIPTILFYYFIYFLGNFIAWRVFARGPSMSSHAKTFICEVFAPWRARNSIDQWSRHGHGLSRTPFFQKQHFWFLSIEQRSTVG